LGSRFPRLPDVQSLAEDEAVVNKAKLGTDAAALVEFFRRRTLRDADIQQIQLLIKQLAGDRFKDREEASKRLVQFGPGGLDLLRQAAKSPDVEVSRRAEIAIETITNNPGPALPSAALRLLARRPTAEALRVVLDYVPFADDARVEEEAVTTLSILSVRE